MMLGAIFQGAKGVFDTVKVRCSNTDLEQLISELSKPEGHVKDLDACDKVLAENNLIFAEYLVKKAGLGQSQKVEKLWEEVKKLMDKKIEAAEQNLKGIAATKLDIVKIVTGLTQISGEVDKELLNFKEQIQRNAEDTNAFRKSMESLTREKLQKFEAANQELTDSINQLEAKINKQNRLFVYLLMPLYVAIVLIIWLNT